jgi:prepilin-type processing-associated H-X9-DG protein
VVTSKMRSTVPRVFLLIRHTDISGVSGTGVVAEGTEWTDGSVSLRWRSEHASTTFYEAGMGAVVAIHGHGGASEVVFLDGHDSCVATRRTS